MDPEDRTDGADRGAAASLDRRRFLQGASGAAVALVAAGQPATALARSLGAGAHTGEGGRRGKPLTLPEGFDQPVAEGSRPPFCHGVASGDPLADRVVIWTRLTAPTWSAPHATVQWRVATDPRMRHVVRRGVVQTAAERDWTVKVDVAGLRPGRRYHYDFSFAGNRSPVGRTRTAPSLHREGIGVAVVACSSYWSGYWNAYARIAERDDVDLVVHCGDHVYDTVDPGEWVRARKDLFDPEYVDFRDWRGLDEVRRRYALHYADADLLALHAAHPMTIAWDNHDIDPGGAATREDAQRAFWEWTPCRPPVAGTDRGGNLVARDVTRDHRSFRYGDIDLFVLDVRTRGDDRYVLGTEQRRWFESGLERSARGATPWRLVVNPMPIAPIGLPGSAYGGWTDRPDDQASMLRFLGERGIDDTIFLAGDAHGAFLADLAPDPATYDPATGAGSTAVEILANSVSRGGADEKVAEVMYEGRYGTPPFADRDGLAPLLEQAQPIARTVEQQLLAGNPSLHQANWRDHGYGMVHLTGEAATLEQWFVPHLAPSPDQALGARFTVARGANHAVEAPPG